MIDSNKDEQETNKKSRIISNSTFEDSTSIAEETGTLDTMKEEKNNITNSWIDEMQKFQCDELDFPIVDGNNSEVFDFDDEAFMRNLESNVLFETEGLEYGWL